MTTLMNKAGKKLFAQHLEQYTPVDPLYESYTDDRGRQKRRKRELPPGLSKRDARILRSVKKRAHYLDKGFRILGMRFGWTFFIGLIPVVGDVADASLNYLLVVKPARNADIPDWLLQRMIMNNMVSAAAGFVPFVGDVVLAMYKANSRNAALLEEFLRIRGEEFLKMGGTVEDEQTNGKGWFGNGKKKASKPLAQAGDLSVADVEQVKPGAGMSAPEMKGQIAAETSLAPPTTNTTKGAPSRSTSSSFGFFGSRSRKNPPPVHQADDKSRFVENVDAVPGSYK